MKKLHNKLTEWQIKAYLAAQNFKNSERGDTNFVSMLLIIGIVVVLAGAFLAIGRRVMSTVEGKVDGFINNLG